MDWKAVLILASQALFSSGFVLSETQCPAPKPCLCHESVIDCRDKGLHQIPQFDYTSNIDSFTTLDFGGNQLSFLPAAGFSALTLTSLYLDNNNISVVHEMAFHGHEKELLILNLANNNLRHLPIAVGRLRVITVFDVSGNPIDGVSRSHDSLTTPLVGFTDSVMNDIGDSLERFSFGHESALRTWPRSLRHLQQLKTLKVRGSNIDLIYQGSFYGFTGTLKSLTIEYAQLKQLPTAVGELKQLEELHFDHSTNGLGDKILIKEPFKEVNKTLKVLTLNYNKFKHFPPVIRYLTNLQNLSLEGNNFTYISDESMDDLKHTKVSVLNLKSCGLKRIPASISELKTLTELDLSYNNIVTIERGDIENLFNLKNLSLKGNPLKYISRSSFSGLTSMEYLDMSETNLTYISEGFQNLFSLKVLDFSNTRMDCTCDMFWVKLWLDIFEEPIRIHGACETIDSLIQEYLNNRIPKCPEYLMSEFKKRRVQ